MKQPRFISLLVTAMLATGAHALSPIPPCDGIEAQMTVHSAGYFGHADSGFVIENYANLANPEGQAGTQPGPIPELNDFNGLRLTECKTGRMIAINGVRHFGEQSAMLATEFLRKRDQNQQPFRYADVKRAANALYDERHNKFTKVLILVENEETCACRDLYPGAWN